MTASINVREQFFDKLSERKLDEALEIFHQDAVFRFPQFSAMKGRRAIRRLLWVIARRFTEIRWVTKRQIYCEDENLIISRWTVHGMFLTGKKYENEGVSIIGLHDDGRVLSMTDYFRSTDFSDQPDDPSVSPGSP